MNGDILCGGWWHCSQSPWLEILALIMVPFIIAVIVLHFIDRSDTAETVSEHPFMFSPGSPRRKEEE